jgi:intracellular sulfur oxidation DsrE/DsrF family protein
MQDDETRPRRREFLGQLGLMALVASAPTHATAAEVPRPHESSPWDLSWVERVSAASYKAVIDSTNISDGGALGLAADVLDMFRDVYGSDGKTHVVVVMRQMAVPMALQDSLWDRYAIGEDRKVNDPVTKAPARRNPYLRPAPNDPDYEVESKIEKLLPRGLTILVCNRAAMNTARSMAEKQKKDPEQAKADVRNGLVPGAYLMPDGIFALVRAQNAGCAYLKG